MDQIADTFPITTDPIWPWSVPGIGLAALSLAAALLLGAAIWSYLRVPGANLRRDGRPIQNARTHILTRGAPWPFALPQSIS